MLPKRLTIQGLYSYQDKQTIDFSKLTEAGIFGIFGAVGSGKSSILEAITFALYGKTERLNERENRNYNMMNLKSKEILIDFEFEHINQSLYRFVVKAKRTSKRFEEVKSFERNAYQYTNEEWIPVESADATNILDLSYENFRRTVIIPQGKFQEFLQLGDKDRTKMMMEIFHLHKYDFSWQTSALEKENDLEIAKLEGELLQLGNNNEAELSELKERLTELTEQEKKLKSEQEKKENFFNELQKLKEQFDQRNQYTSALQTLENNKTHFEEKKQKVDAFQKAKLYFESYLLRKKELLLEVHKRTENIHTSTSKLNQLKSELEKENVHWEEIEKNYSLLDDWNIQIQELTNIEEILNFQKKYDALEKAISLQNTELEKLISIQEKFKTQLSELEKNIENTKKDRPSNIFVFAEAGEWFQQKKNLEAQLKERLEEQKKLEERITKGKVFFETLSFTFDNWQKESDNRKKALIQRFSELNNEKIEIATKIELHQYALNLKEGEACPICGSMHHPSLLNDDEDVFQKKEKLENLILENLESQSILEQNTAKANQYATSILTFEEQVSALQKNIGQYQKNLNSHLESFIWKEFVPNNESEFIYKKQKADKAIVEITNLENEKTILKNEQEQNSNQINILQNKLIESRTQYTSISENIENLKKKIKFIDLQKISDYNIESLLIQQKNLRSKIETTKSEYTTVQSKIQKSQKEIVALEAQIQISEVEQSKEAETLKNVTGTISVLLQQHDIPSESIVEQTLSQQLDLQKEHTAIQEFQNQLYAAEQKLQQINELLLDKNFDESEWLTLKGTLEGLKESITLNQTAIVQHVQTINQLTNTIAIHKKISDHLEKKSIRKINIQTLKNIFIGNGFVNFISSVYLKNLCVVANDRFRKLTHNQLLLELGDNNDFLIRDVLNEGKTRSVKTLSGGQTFQASLSLALALADSIQYQNKSEQNFFFLDEGFGSLDKESLTTIYDTLQSLRKENRIVGIISHVEDLQQEMPISLVIRKDTENGSQIELFMN